MYTYQTGNQTIDYKIEVVPNRTDITVQICDKEGVKVIIPRGLNENNVRSIIARKATWILKQLNGSQPAEEKPAAPKKEAVKKKQLKKRLLKQQLLQLKLVLLKKETNSLT